MVRFGRLDNDPNYWKELRDQIIYDDSEKNRTTYIKALRNKVTISIRDQSFRNKIIMLSMLFNADHN